MANLALELDAGIGYAWYVKGKFISLKKGCVFQELKMYSEAINSYAKGLEGNPMDINCLKGISTASYLMEDYAETLNWVQIWIKSLGPSTVFMLDLLLVCV